MYIKNCYKILLLLALTFAVACQPVSEKEKAEREIPLLKKAHLYSGISSKCLFPIHEGKKWGFINEEGKKVIETLFLDVGSFSEGLCAARAKGKYGYIDNMGNWAINPIYNKAHDFSGGLAFVNIEGKNFFIDKKGKVVFQTPYRETGDFHDGYATVQTYNYKYGFINITGKLIVDTIHSMVRDFSEGMAVICKDKPNSGSWNYSLINTELKEVVPFGKYEEIKSFNSGLAYAVLKGGGGTKIEKDGTITDIPGTYGYIDNLGKLIFKYSDDSFLDMGDFSEGLAVVSHNSPDPDGYVNEMGKVVIKAIYEEAGSFSENLAPVKNKNWGFISKSGKVKIPFAFDQVSIFKNGLAKAKKGNVEGYINTKGNFVWQDTIINYAKAKPYSVYLDSVNVFFKTRGYLYAYSKPEFKNNHTGSAESNNIAKNIKPYLNFEKNKFYLKVNANDRSIFGNGYLGGKLYIINSTDTAMTFEAQDSRLYCNLQALNKKSIWEDIEYLPSSWCGNSYHKVILGKSEFWEFTIPIYQGDYQTKLRYKLIKNKKGTAFYSNTFEGRINSSQFIGEKEGYTPQDIMDPYIE